MQLSVCHNFLLSEEEADAEEQTGQQPGPKEVEEEADTGYFSQLQSDLHEGEEASSTPAAKMSSDFAQLPTTTGDRTPGVNHTLMVLIVRYMYIVFTP